MTIRKRKTPTPYFKLPPPFNPISGERAALVTHGVSPYCALMQIAEEDVHENYVICRGFDPRIRKFLDSIPVAKPYGSREAGEYTVGQVFPALLPLQRLGQTPGVASVTQGHPADLDEVVDNLYTDDGTAINWLLIDTNVPETDNLAVEGYLAFDLHYSVSVIPMVVTRVTSGGADPSDVNQQLLVGNPYDYLGSDINGDDRYRYCGLELAPCRAAYIVLLDDEGDHLAGPHWMLTDVRCVTSRPPQLWAPVPAVVDMPPLIPAPALLG